MVPRSPTSELLLRLCCLRSDSRRLRSNSLRLSAASFNFLIRPWSSNCCRHRCSIWKVLSNRRPREERSSWGFCRWICRLSSEFITDGSNGGDQPTISSSNGGDRRRRRIQHTNTMDGVSPTFPSSCSFGNLFLMEIFD